MRARQTKPDLNTARGLLEGAQRHRTLFWALHRGYPWFRDRYLPALAQFTRQARILADRRLASDAYYTLGDVLDVFYGAPLAACRAYLRSSQLDPTCSGGWREAGEIRGRFGEYRAALRLIDKALRANPTDRYAQDEQVWIIRDQAENAPAWLRKDDPLARAAELLAAGKPKAALAVVGSKRSISAWQRRARIFGAMGRNAEVIEAWRAIARARGPVMMAYPDWFFLPRAVYNNEAFWRTLLRIGYRFHDGVHISYDRLIALLGDRDAVKHVYSDEAVRRRIRCWLVVIRYQLARIRLDAATLRQLCGKHPGWTEPAEALRRLKIRSEPATRSHGRVANSGPASGYNVASWSQIRNR